MRAFAKKNCLSDTICGSSFTFLTGSPSRRSHPVHLPVYDPNKCFLFALGRNAMYAVCQAMGLKSGDEVLTPAFDCDSTLTPFRALGYKLRFIKSDPYTFEVDVDDVRSKLSPRVKLVHIINHFGMPQPWDELLALKQNTGIPILEDNAFSLFSKLGDKYFGTFGDASIFSLYKMLPLIDGGMLRINNESYQARLPKRKVRWFYPTERRRALGLVLAKLGFHKLPDPIKNRFRRPASLDPIPPLYSDGSGYPEWHLRDQVLHEFSCDFFRPMSRSARFQMSRYSPSDLIEITEKIRVYYLWVVDRLKGMKGIRVLWPEIPEGIVPACVSVLIDAHRDHFLKRLSEKKYGVMAWPTLSMDVINQLDQFGEISIIGRKILQINISVFRVTRPDFPRYLDNLVNEFHDLCLKYFN